MSFRFNFQVDNANEEDKLLDDNNKLEELKTNDEKKTYEIAGEEIFLNKPKSLLKESIETKNIIINDLTIKRIIYNSNKKKQNDDLSTIIKNYDVKNGLYEGGFKLWECSIDLMKYLNTINFKEQQDIFEIGCGHGLPTLYMLKKFPNLINSIIFQDLNQQVLKEITSKNVYINNINNYNIRYISGDWQCPKLLKLIPANSFNLILSSETIYNYQSSINLLQLIKYSINKDNPKAMALIAAKRYYFGLDGSVNTFLTLVQQDKTLISQIVYTFDDGKSNIRDIIQITFKKINIYFMIKDDV